MRGKITGSFPWYASGESEACQVEGLAQRVNRTDCSTLASSISIHCSFHYDELQLLDPNRSQETPL